MWFAVGLLQLSFNPVFGDQEPGIWMEHLIWAIFMGNTILKRIRYVENHVSVNKFWGSICFRGHILEYGTSPYFWGFRRRSLDQRSTRTGIRTEIDQISCILQPKSFIWFLFYNRKNSNRFGPSNRFCCKTNCCKNFYMSHDWCRSWF